jgi:hypothetical protein
MQGPSHVGQIMAGNLLAVGNLHRICVGQRV